MAKFVRLNKNSSIIRYVFLRTSETHLQTQSYLYNSINYYKRKKVIDGLVIYSLYILGIQILEILCTNFAFNLVRKLHICLRITFWNIYFH